MTPEPTSLIVSGSSALEGVVEGTPESQAQAKVRVAQVAAMQVISCPAPVIKTADEYTAAGANFAAIKAKITALEAERTSITQPINAGLRKINDLFKGATEQLNRALGIIEAPMRGYVREQDDIRAAAVRAAQAESDRLRREQEAAQAVAMAELDAARKVEREAAQALATANPFLAAARASQADAATAAAQVARESAEAAIRESHRLAFAPPAVEVPAARAAGTKVMRPWKYEITDPSLLPREFLIANEQLIGATVRTLKGDAKIAGVRVYQDLSIGGR